MKVILFACFLILTTSLAYGSDCSYWNTLVDPRAPKVSVAKDSAALKNVLAGMRCLLKLEGRKERGVRYGQKAFVSQTVPIASVEINALYQISELFYGNTEFANALALTDDPPKLVGEFEVEEFDSPVTVKKAFISYRKWFAEVERLGLQTAREQKLDPLAGSGVKWH